MQEPTTVLSDRPTTIRDAGPRHDERGEGVISTAIAV